MHRSIVPVLLGGDSNVYGMARSFYEEYGVYSHVICKGVFHVICNTKLILSIQVEPDLEDDEAFVRILRDYAKKRSEQNPSSEQEQLVLVPCADGYTKLLVDHQDELRDLYHFSIMSPEVFNMFDSKQAFYDTCEKYGLAYPKTYYITASDWAEFEVPCGFPCIVKPSNSVAYWNCSYPGKKKAFEVRSREEYEQLCERIFSSDYDDGLIVQDFIPGDDSAMRVMNCYSDQDGKVTMMTLGRVLLEEQTPMGIGSYGAIATAYDMKLAQEIKGFLEAVGYVGYSNFDLKFDSRDNSYKYFEINPRQGRSSYFATASGKNLARYLVRDVIFHQNEDIDIATMEDAALWTAVPFVVIKKYVKDKEALDYAERLKRSHKVSHAYWAQYDRNPRRLVYYALNQIKQIENYSHWSGKRHIDD